MPDFIVIGAAKGGTSALFHYLRHFPREQILVLAPAAVAIHDLPPIVRERTRQGHDTITACWANPRLPGARWLWLGILAVPLFLALRMALDGKRR